MSERASERETDRKKRERETLALYKEKEKKKKEENSHKKIETARNFEIYEFIYFSFIFYLVS